MQGVILGTEVSQNDIHVQTTPVLISVCLMHVCPFQVPPIPRTHDEGNPDMESEFFDTRQVQSVNTLTWSTAALSALFRVWR